MKQLRDFALFWHQGRGQQSSGAWSPDFWCPFKLTNRFFCVGSRKMNFSFVPNVFMCPRYFLVLSEHCQHERVYTFKKTKNKKVGAPEFWCLGTKTLVPQMFLTAKCLIPKMLSDRKRVVQLKKRCQAQTVRTRLDSWTN